MTATGVGYFVPDPPLIAGDATVVAHDAGAILTDGSMKKIHTNTGDADSQENTLPTAATVAGECIRFVCTVAQNIVVKPASGEKIFSHGSGVADEKLTIAGAFGAFADLYSDGVEWLVFSSNGILTKA
jgi:hypothetical protein